MSIILPHYFEELKSCVLSVSGITHITPCDCKLISSMVMDKTRQRISETTLKRVYGFAFSKFKPSLFTIDVLSRYCGYTGWEDFCGKHIKKEEKKTPVSLSWDTLKHNAEKVTGFTLQALKNRSGIPYNQTISRRFAQEHFDFFLNEDYTATVLAAPAGYGKTLALCHWIDERLEKNAKNETDDIILFFSSNALINVFLSGRDINEWLLSLLGYSPKDDLASLLNEKNNNGGKFFLVVDGFDEHMFKPDQFRIILNQIVDIFSLYQTSKWFKLILTMRQSSWLNYKHEIDDGQSSWFLGFTTNNHALINVPLFNMDEIQQLCKKINPAANTSITAETAGKFNHPLYFQFYYKNHKDDFTLSHIDHVCIYDLISTFILNKVYLGQHSAEKILLLKEIVEVMEPAGKNYSINKLQINSLMKQYHHAYHELLSIGFLREVNDSTDFEENIFIQFSNSDFLEYTLAKKLLLNNNYTFNHTLIETLNGLYGTQPIKLQVLKWMIIYAMKSDQEEGFKYLTEVELKINQKADLIVFLAELFEKECFNAPQIETVKNYVKQNCIKGLFDYFMGIEFIDPQYEKVLRILLRFDLANSQKILVYTCLAAIAIIKLDVNELEDNVSKLKSFQQTDYVRFPINPLTCLDCVYYYLKYGILKKEFLADITNFYFNCSQQPQLKSTPANDIIFMLAAYSSVICHNPNKGLRLISALEKNYRQQPEIDSAYNFFLKIIKADRYFMIGEIQKALEIYLSVLLAYNKYETSYTFIMRLLFISLKIKASLFIHNHTELNKHLTSLMHLTGQAGYNLPKLYVLAFLLKHKNQLVSAPQFEKKLHFDFIKTLRECGVQADVFLINTEKVRITSR